MGVFDFVKEAGAKVGVGGDGDTKVADVVAEAASEARAAEVAAKAKARKATAKVSAERQEQLAESKKAAGLEAYVGKLGFDVTDLDIRFDDGVATVTGSAADQATREKVILAIGNTAGVAEVHDEITVAAPAAAPVAEAAAPEAPAEPESQMHVVVKGDTLSGIAKAYYGDAGKYPVIFEANRPLLSDPDKIYVGQVLRIPAL